MPSDKKSARKHGLKSRALLTKEQREEKDARIFARVIGKINDLHCIGTYVSMNDEADTKRIIAWCFEHHKRVAVPKVTGNTLVFHEIQSFADLKAGAFGVMEPYMERAVDFSEIEFMIVPLSAYDESNHRTGYGKGYYDSVLKQCSHTAGIAYTAQKTDLIITDPWDVSLDEIIAE